MADIVKKVIIIGDSGTGKSSILLQFVDGSFTESFISTIGVDFRIQRQEVNNKSVKLQLWDTAGQERFRTIISSYYRGVDAVIVTFDVSNTESFDNVRSWFEEARRLAPSGVSLFLAGNKKDLTKAQQVQYETAKSLADEYDAAYFEVSAKSGENVEAMFTHITEKLIASNSRSSAPEPLASAAPEEPDDVAADTQNIIAELEKTAQSQLKVKAVVVGDSGVGKSDVVKRLSDQEFSKESLPTIGVDFCSKKVVVDNEEVRVQFWDTAGQERFRSITSSYYRGADAVVVAFDLTSAQSFEHVQRWVDEVTQTVEKTPKLILIGNKADLKDSRSVSYADAKALADKNGMAYLEVSAKDDSNVNELKLTIARVAIGKKNAETSATETVQEQRGEKVAEKPTEQVERVKAVFVGDSGVGKSNILTQFTKGEFSLEHVPTIGVDFFVRTLKLEGDERPLRLQLWDTAGQERFRTITSSYYRGADVIAVVFDVTFVDSFTNVQNWLREVKRFAVDETPILLVGNKVDRAESRRVDYDTARKLAERHNLAYFEVSAKDGSNLPALFNAVTAAAIRDQPLEATVAIATATTAENQSKVLTAREDSATERSLFSNGSERNRQRGSDRSAKAADGARKIGSGSSRWIDTRKLHDSLVKSETPETGCILRQCESLLEVERTFVKDLTEMIDEERSFAQRKREVLNAKWNDRVYEPVKQKLVERQRADGYAASIRSKLTSYEDYLDHSGKRDASFLNDYDSAEYDPFKWQRAESTHTKPVRLTAIDPCQLYLHNQREETRLIAKYDHAARRFAKNDETGRFEFYDHLPQLAPGQRDENAKELPASRRSQVASAPARAQTFVSAVAFGTHYFDQNKKKAPSNWSNMAYFDVDSLSRRNTVDEVQLARNKSHFDFKWTNENDQALIDQEMKLSKRRSFPKAIKQKTSLEFSEAHFKLEPLAQHAPRHYDDRYVVGAEDYPPYFSTELTS